MNRFLLPIYFFLTNLAIGQNSIDELKNAILNSKLTFEIAMRGDARMMDSNRIIIQTIVAVVTSFDVDKVISNNDTEKIMDMLQPLLSDTSKDWYTNILLYQITQRSAAPLFVIDTKEKWISSYRNVDMAYWADFFSKRKKRKEIRE